MDLYAVLVDLILPPGGIVLMMGIGLCLLKKTPRFASTLMGLACLLLWVSSLSVLTPSLASWVESSPSLSPEHIAKLSKNAQAIVVLGAGKSPIDSAWGQAQPSSMGMARLRYAAFLSRQTQLPLLLSGGNSSDQSLSEAQVFNQVLQDDYGLKAQWVEEKSTNTWENAAFTAELMLKPHISNTIKQTKSGVKTVVLVTHAFHMSRAKKSFELQGFDVIPAPMGSFESASIQKRMGWLPDAHSLSINRLLMREALAQRLYPFIVNQANASKD